MHAITAAGADGRGGGGSTGEHSVDGSLSEPSVEDASGEQSVDTHSVGGSAREELEPVQDGPGVAPVDALCLDGIPIEYSVEEHSVTGGAGEHSVDDGPREICLEVHSVDAGLREDDVDEHSVERYSVDRSAVDWESREHSLDGHSRVVHESPVDLTRTPSGCPAPPTAADGCVSRADSECMAASCVVVAAGVTASARRVGALRSRPPTLAAALRSMRSTPAAAAAAAPLLVAARPGTRGVGAADAVFTSPAYLSWRLCKRPGTRPCTTSRSR